MPRKELTIEEAKQRADRWHAMGEDYLEAQRLAARFSDAGPHRVIEMWGTGRNDKGKPLTKFEIRALVERWSELFGCLPPATGTSTAPATPVQPPPADDTMLRMRDVARITSMSPSNIKRRVRAGGFPKPTKISARRIGWPAHKVKAWLADREAGSR
jgi:prophage regulatory protein